MAGYNIREKENDLMKTKVDVSRQYGEFFFEIKARIKSAHYSAEKIWLGEVYR